MSCLGYICRLCLRNYEQHAKVEEISVAASRLQMTILNNDTELVDIISKTTSLKIMMESPDESILLLCHKCEHTLREFGVFRERCIENDHIFRNLAVNRVKLEDNLNAVLDTATEPLFVAVKNELQNDLLVTDDVSLESSDNGYDERSDSNPECITVTETESPKEREEHFQCDKCHRHFKFKGHVRTHLRKCKGQQQAKNGQTTAPKQSAARIHKCEICGKSFGFKSVLQRHARTHTGDRPFVCNVCGKRFGDRANLNVHVRVHTGEKPYECTTCGRSFSQSTTLVVHNRTHTGEKPLKCKYCDKTYRDNTTLRMHILSHTGEKPHKCSVCGRAFAQQKHLNMHRVTHTGEKSFLCSVCGKAFNRRSNMVAHTRTHMRPHQ